MAMTQDVAIFDNNNKLGEKKIIAKVLVLRCKNSSFTHNAYV